MVVNLLFLPDVVLTEILKYLPGKSLHVCRQVHSRLNQKIKELIWANKKILLEFEVPDQKGAGIQLSVDLETVREQRIRKGSKVIIQTLKDRLKECLEID